MQVLKDIAEAVQEGNAPKTKALVQEALAQGIKAWDVLNQGMMPALHVLGNQLKDGTVSLPEVMIAVGAVKAGLAILQPGLLQRKVEGRGVVIIGTVSGDVHSLGKDLVVMMLEGNGFQVINLGTDVAPARFVEAAQQYRPDIVALSGLLTSSRIAMRETIAALDAAGLRKRIRIMVGGGAVDALTAQDIGADAYGEDAAVAPEIAFKLLTRV